MKTQLIAALLSLLSITRIIAQGDLNPPPGPPAPTMKSLDQVEPRIIVNATNTPGDGSNTFIISTPGSYYLTGNITGESGKSGISIQANDVTLDLHGCAIAGVPGSTHGVNVPIAMSNLTIRNGILRGWGQKGVNAVLARNGTLESLKVSNNATTGLAGGYNFRITGCVCLSNISEGITSLGGSTIKDCSLQGNGTGIFLSDLDGGYEISGCTSFANTGVGIAAFHGATLNGCTVRYNGSVGISVSTGCSISNCTVSRNYGDGIVAFSRNLIVNNNTTENGLSSPNGDGIECYGGENRIDGNHTTANNGRGIRSLGGVDIIVRNTSQGNTVGAYAPGTSLFGPVGNPSTSTSPWANF